MGKTKYIQLWETAEDNTGFFNKLNSLENRFKYRQIQVQTCDSDFEIKYTALEVE